MKYGDTLRQHSVPEWAYYNVDYDVVKQLIKECTSTGKGKAIDIPGQGGDASVDSDKRLYGALKTEHDRVGLFVKSKSNEIQGRLSNADKTLRKLQLRNGPGGPRPYLLQRYGKLERDTIEAGEEIRSLSRFIVAQRTAFRKLLKKYKKWSHSTNLNDLFEAEVLSRPTSFTKVSLEAKFDQWTEILQEIRVATTSGIAAKRFLTASPLLAAATKRSHSARRVLQDSSSIAAKFDAALATASDVNFDTIFSETPMGDSGSRAVYWVHHEQMIELQVLLLQHLRLYLAKATIDASSLSSLSASPVTTRRSSWSQRQDGSAERETDSGVIIMDQIDDYADRQSQATVNDSENASGEAYTRPAVAARWTSTMDDATIAFRQQTEEDKPSLARVRRKHLGALLDAERDYKPWQTSGNVTPVDGCFASSSQDNTTPNGARDILEKRRESLQPLVAIFSKRTRFLGLGNSAKMGQWAVLDAQIGISKVARQDLAGKDWAANLGRSAQNFPFAILRIRQEGKFAANLVEVLDKSHLTERVRGFSLASHAIWECWKPRGMSPPFWIPALSRDIRKVPDSVTLGRRKSSQAAISAQSKTSSASSNSEYDKSGSSIGIAAESSATSVPTTPNVESRDFHTAQKPDSLKAARKVAYDESAHKPARKKKKEDPRYWNEYDFPDSDDDANAYYIYVDQDREDKWLGQDTAQKLYTKFHSLFTRQKAKILDEERSLLQPLIVADDEDTPSSPTDSEEDSPIKTTFFGRKKKSVANGYGSFQSTSHGKTQHKPITQLSQLFLPPVGTASAPTTSSRMLIASLSFAASAILCILDAALAATGRNKQKGEVDAGILFGVVASLSFALVGLVSVLTAKDGIGLLNWAIIGVVFGIVCLADGVLVGWVFV